MKKLLFIFLILLWVGCETPTEFSKKALNDTAFSVKDTSITLAEILEQYKGKKILIDVWASWCSDCIKGLPKVKLLQKEFPETVFIFLSVDTDQQKWKKGIQRFKISGVHYNFPKGMKKGDFVEFIGLNWIPRYMVINEKGDITLFKATNANDKELKKALQ